MSFKYVLIALFISYVNGLRNSKPECEDGAKTGKLFSAGAFHTCAANGTIAPKGESPKRKVVCFGWQEFGQGMAPEMDLVQSVSGKATFISGTSHHTPCHVSHFYVVCAYSGSEAYLRYRFPGNTSLLGLRHVRPGLVHTIMIMPPPVDSLATNPLLLLFFPVRPRTSLLAWACQSKMSKRSSILGRGSSTFFLHLSAVFKFGNLTFDGRADCRAASIHRG
jgi:hypothetical protein